MKFGNIAAPLRRHGRLLAVCGLSVLLHAAVIAWLDTRMSAPLPLIGNAPLAVRLAGVAPAAPPAPAPPATPAAAPATATPDLPAPAPLQADAPAAIPLQAAAAQPSPAPAGGGVAAVEMPSRYRVAVPPSASLRYEVRGGAGSAGEATLNWETDGVDYRLAVDGILGDIESEGATDDAGIAPRQARYRQGAGSAGIAFDRERGAIVLESLGRSVQDATGSQDGATLLMQLVGIGLADPDQMQDTVDLYVGRPDGAAVERFQVLGRERITTPLGAMETLHLARAGKAALEVWLAPGQGWLPVQLRATAPDGSVRTQVIKQIVRQPAP
ncbi:DUF3108 domain-containing protein [uncultured Massilia sp.]|uniref:DUF3108 domain-containing protein n=1 Tax=uncultured Massilia sp. TaxID=169973 RepID=UPI002584B12E|nr:DUF3108 domain-containing protein [uncultured Massilia sp.]